jgi:hypothetical protein
MSEIEQLDSLVNECADLYNKLRAVSPALVAGIEPTAAVEAEALLTKARIGLSMVHQNLAAVTVFLEEAVNV